MDAIDDANPKRTAGTNGNPAYVCAHLLTLGNNSLDQITGLKAVNSFG